MTPRVDRHVRAAREQRDGNGPGCPAGAKYSNANTIERALISQGSATLNFEGLPATAFTEVRGTPETFDAAARQAILEALAATGGRIYGPFGAAARLGMPPSTLQGKMQRLGISRSTR